tara:strand:- start:37 stop:1713 length:1677 start_codon:yes stop_codon:yes gene_type:complete
MTNILAFNITHDSSVSYLENGILKFFCKEERVSGVKRDNHPFKSLDIFNSLGYDPDHILYLTPSNSEPNIYHTYENYIRKFFNKNLENYSNLNHHSCHASLAFYNSGYEEAVIVVIDRNGSICFVDGNPIAREAESIYIGNRKKSLQPIYKNFYLESDESFRSDIERQIRNYYPYCDVYSRSSYGITTVYEAATTLIGQNPLDNGKTMGLSSYCSEKNFDELFYNGFADSKFFVKDLMHSHPQFSDLGTCFFGEQENITRDVNIENYSYYAKRAKQVQTKTQIESLNLIKKYTEKTGIKNVCVVGGYGLNVIANNFYLKNLPDIDFYFEPCSDDTGVSLGGAMMKHYELTGDCPSQIKDNFYHYYNHDERIQGGRKSSIDEICDLLINQKSVAIFEGCPESGPRALGHRSILFDSRNNNAKNIVNKIKKREWYRPFAGVILQEDFEEYFYTEGLQKSEYMTISFDAKDNAKNILSGIIHIDNTCRIQTVSDGFLYKLLKLFKSKTQCPALLNTSFNLAGKPLVQTKQNAVDTFNTSLLDCLFFVDENIIYKKTRNKLD